MTMIDSRVTGDRMRRTRIWVQLVFCVVALPLLGGCAMLESFLKDMQRPSAEVVGVRIARFGLESTTLAFDVEVSNPYRVDLPIANVDYRLATGDTQFLDGRAALQGVVPAVGRKVYVLPIEIGYAGVLSVLRGVRPGAVVPYQAEIGISVDTPIAGNIRLPLRKAGEIPIPAIPEISLDEIRWEKVSLGTVRGVLRLRCSSRNTFAMQLTKLDYGLSLSGKHVARVGLPRPTDLTPGQDAMLEVPVSFSPLDLGVALLEAVRSREGNYSLQGMLDAQTPFGPLHMPVEKSGVTAFRK